MGEFHNPSFPPLLRAVSEIWRAQGRRKPRQDLKRGDRQQAYRAYLTLLEKGDPADAWSVVELQGQLGISDGQAAQHIVKAAHAACAK